MGLLLGSLITNFLKSKYFHDCWCLAVTVVTVVSHDFIYTYWFEYKIHSINMNMKNIIECTQ